MFSSLSLSLLIGFLISPKPFALIYCFPTVLNVCVEISSELCSISKATHTHVHMTCTQEERLGAPTTWQQTAQKDLRRKRDDGRPFRLRAVLGQEKVFVFSRTNKRNGRARNALRALVGRPFALTAGVVPAVVGVSRSNESPRGNGAKSYKLPFTVKTNL